MSFIYSYILTGDELKHIVPYLLLLCVLLVLSTFVLIALTDGLLDTVTVTSLGGIFI